jgi:hypothetical protein
MWPRIAYVIGRSLRESGQALDRVGSRLQGNYAFTEQRMLACNHLAHQPSLPDRTTTTTATHLHQRLERGGIALPWSSRLYARALWLIRRCHHTHNATNTIMPCPTSALSFLTQVLSCAACCCACNYASYSQSPSPIDAIV